MKNQRFIHVLIVLAALLFASSAVAQERAPRPGAERSKPRQDATEPGAADPMGGDQGARSGVAYSKTFGAGLGYSSLASGLSFKYYLNNATSVQTIIGRTFAWGIGGIAISADITQDVAELYYNPTSGRLLAYVGGGAGLFTYSVLGASGSLFGVSLVGGVAFHFNEVPFEIAVDARPTYVVGDYLYYDGFHLWEGGAAARWYF